MKDVYMEEELIEKKTKKEKRKLSEKAINIIFDFLTIMCIIIMAIAVVPKTLQNDTFYNIKCGEYIFKNGIFNLTTDPFSWHNLPYTWPHWLYDLGTFILYHTFRKPLGTRVLCSDNYIYCYFGDFLI